MNHERLETAVRTALEQQARQAPSNQHLLHNVLARDAGRERRRRTIGAGIAAVATIGVIVGSSLLPLGDRTGPGPGPDSRQLESADGPGILSQQEIQICLLGTDGQLDDIALTTRSRSGTDRDVDTTVRAIDDQQSLIYQADNGRTAVRLELGTEPFADSERARPIDIGGRQGWILDHRSEAARVLQVETGIQQLLLTITASRNLPEESRMIAWAEKISVDEGGETCR